MANVNKVILIGNLTRDPELKMLPSNTAVCEFGMAINRNWTDGSGEKKEEVTFVDVSAFGKQAETLNKYVKKGHALFVEGRLKLDQWDAQDGTKRSKMRVVIDNFQFLANKPQQAEGYEGEPAQPQQTQPQRPANNLRPKANRPTDAGMRKSASEKMMSPPADDADVPF